MREEIDPTIKAMNFVNEMLALFKVINGEQHQRVTDAKEAEDQLMSMIHTLLNKPNIDTNITDKINQVMSNYFDPDLINKLNTIKLEDFTTNNTWLYKVGEKYNVPVESLFPPPQDTESNQELFNLFDSITQSMKFSQ